MLGTQTIYRNNLHGLVVGMFVLGWFVLGWSDRCCVGMVALSQTWWKAVISTRTWGQLHRSRPLLRLQRGATGGIRTPVFLPQRR